VIEDLLPDDIGDSDRARSGRWGNDARAMMWLRSAVERSRDIPLPRSGRTLERWRYLADVSADDLVRARLIEGHLDAVAILAEMGLAARTDPGVPHAVWAADPGGIGATPTSDGWDLSGTKPYCSGSTRVEVALVTATAPDGPRLFLLRSSEIDQLEVITGSWPSTGMAASASVELRFDLTVGHDAALGGPHAYVDRAGFWAGGAGVAACWLGGAGALLQRLIAEWTMTADMAGVEQAGRHRAALAAAGALGREAASLVDDPASSVATLRAAATGFRVAVAEAARGVLATNLARGGSRLLCLDEEHSRRTADLGAYLTQLAPAPAAEYATLHVDGSVL
jgi:hypothetical protein